MTHKRTSCLAVFDQKHFDPLTFVWNLDPVELEQIQFFVVLLLGSILEFEIFVPEYNQPNSDQFYPFFGSKYPRTVRTRRTD